MTCHHKRGQDIIENIIEKHKINDPIILLKNSLEYILS